jgi:hypothetical protein
LLNVERRFDEDVDGQIIRFKQRELKDAHVLFDSPPAPIFGLGEGFGGDRDSGLIADRFQCPDASNQIIFFESEDQIEIVGQSHNPMRDRRHPTHDKIADAGLF